MKNSAHQARSFLKKSGADGLFSFRPRLSSESFILAPEAVRTLFDVMLPFAEIVQITAEALQLRDAYIQAGVVSEKSRDDATHVALATVSGCEIIVSWNFKHIVHF